jgi:Glycosyl hydrolases family 16/S-layer homology domain
MLHVRKNTIALLSAAALALGSGGFLAPPSVQAASNVQAGATTAAESLNWSGTEAAVTRGWGVPQTGDEFNYTGVPDSTKWSVYNSVGHAGKGLRSPDAIRVGNGRMTISGDANGKTGGMSAKFARQKYGRWEIRMRTSAAEPKYHAVSILWPDSPSSKCWEIDYAEQTGDLGLIKFFLHYGCPDGVQTYARQPLDLTQWHNYAVEWSPSGIKGFIDGQQWFSDSDPAHQPDVSMHQTLQLDWFPVAGQATKPSWMEVDWVRTYSINGSGDPRGGTTGGTGSTAFTDVPAGHPFYTPINWMAATGISTGYKEPDGSSTFHPDEAVSRGATAAFLYRLAGSPSYTAPARSPFSDIGPDSQFYKEITWLASKGITTGWTEPDGTRTFRPAEPVSRLAMAAFLYRYAGKPYYDAPSTPVFADRPVGSQFYDEICWLASTGVTTGWAEADGTRTFRGEQSVVRYETAAFLYRYNQKFPGN